jgi:hypothetical protein
MGESMSMRRSILSLAVVVAWALAVSAQAATIDVFSTGVDGTGSVVAAGSVDAHYSLVSGPVTGGTVVPTSIPSPPWIANTATAQWIAPNYDQSFNNPYAGGGNLPGLYVYETTFDLTGLDASTAVITGGYASDDGGEIWLNGVNLGVSTGTPPYSALTAFTINSGFLAGVNTLQFRVTNTGLASDPWTGPQGQNPTGLYVSITSTYARPIPEPNSLIFFGTGVLVVGMAIRKRATTS